MKTIQILRSVIALFAAAILLTPPVVAAPKSAPVDLTEHGRQLEARYTESLGSLRNEVAAKLPAVDAAKQKTFLAAREQLTAIQLPTDEADANARRQYDDARTLAEDATLTAARALLADLDGLLASDAHDVALMKIAILTHGTPRGLAEFAQQGKEEEALLVKLFADEALMKQILVAGGANGGEYGEAMQVYTAILGSSERARGTGTIFQRLALGTAIHMPWQGGKPEAGVHGIVQRTQYDVDQVQRYLHYEKAYLDGELDPAFKDMKTWECRFITDSEYSDEDLAWTRSMMRIYRPDHITMDDYKWRYVRFIKSDVPYCSTTHDPSLGTKPQMEIALGGICGRRAFLGRLTTRAFGIPTRASTQSGHAALSHWTPDGWVICLGAWWSQAWCGPQGGLDFLLDSQARELAGEYLKVLRAQWIGDALGEEDVSIRHFGVGGGFWDGLAFYKKHDIVKNAEIAALELAGGMKLGESDELLGDEVGEDIEIPESARKIATHADGSITIPATACYSPRKPSDRILFLKSWDEGYQLHYSRLGQQPELVKYRFEVPAAGDYELTSTVANVAPGLRILVRLNRDEPAPYDLPFTKGAWMDSEPINVTLEAGRNMISITARTPNRGVSIKEWRLTPVK